MKRRLDEIERKMNTPVLHIVDAVDWTDAPPEVLDAVERLETVAATLPPGLSGGEKYGRLGAMPECFDDCKRVALWVQRMCATEATL